jgi:EAL and modified HD-GYP domain-containing signal transduction protein
MDMSIADALKELAVPARVKGALTGVPGTMRDVLELVLAFERGDWEMVDAKSHSLEPSVLASAYMASLDWAHAASAAEIESRRPPAPSARLMR